RPGGQVLGKAPIDQSRQLVHRSPYQAVAPNAREHVALPSFVANRRRRPPARALARGLPVPLAVDHDRGTSGRLARPTSSAMLHGPVGAPACVAGAATPVAERTR